MLSVQIAVPEASLDLIFGHINHCNKFPLEIDRGFEAGQIKFAGIWTALNTKSSLYEGQALFLNHPMERPASELAKTRWTSSGFCTRFSK